MFVLYCPRETSIRARTFENDSKNKSVSLVDVVGGVQKFIFDHVCLMENNLLKVSWLWHYTNTLATCFELRNEENFNLSSRGGETISIIIDEGHKLSKLIDFSITFVIVCNRSLQEENVWETWVG